MTRSVPRGTLALAGMAAGFAVGLLDGGWAAVAAQATIPGGVLGALLVASVDGLWGGVAGLVIEALVRCARWGRTVRTHPVARGMAVVFFGVAGGAFTVSVAAATIDRHNRLLAAGLACLTALASATAGAALTPALGRLLSGGGGAPRARRGLAPAFLVLAPLAAAAVQLVIVSAVMTLRMPLTAAAAWRRLGVVAFEAALLPAFLVWAEGLPVRLRWRVTVPLAVLLFSGSAGLLHQDLLVGTPAVHPLESCTAGARHRGGRPGGPAVDGAVERAVVAFPLAVVSRRTDRGGGDVVAGAGDL